MTMWVIFSVHFTPWVSLGIPWSFLLPTMVRQENEVESHLNGSQPRAPSAAGKDECTKAIAWWPGTIPAGTTNNALVTAWDELPTFAELIAARAKIESDGVSFAPLLKGANNPQQARFLYWQLDEKVAVRYGDWKWVGIRYHTPFEKNFLYNIALDPGELSNLAGSNPEQLHQLQAMVDKFRLAQ